MHVVMLHTLQDLKYRLVVKKHECISNLCAKLSNTNLDHI